MSVLAELKNLSITAPDRALVTGVNVLVVERRVTALVGPSGAGKSLTARAMMCVLDVLPGLVTGSLHYPALDKERDLFAGVHGKGHSGQQRLLKETAVLRGAYVSYAPQAASSALNPGRTIGRQIELAMNRRERPSKDPGGEIRDILAEVGLGPEVASALPGELSGGMAQRAALAIAVAPQPRFVIADEPETGLDPVLRRAVVELLVNVVRDHGAGLLLISHHEDTVDRIADDVVRLSPTADDATHEGSDV